MAETALSIVEKVIGEKLAGKADPPAEPTEQATDTRNQAAVGLSKLGAAKGGKGRALKFSNKKRTKIAKKPQGPVGTDATGLDRCLSYRLK